MLPNKFYSIFIKCSSKYRSSIHWLLTPVSWKMPYESSQILWTPPCQLYLHTIWFFFFQNFKVSDVYDIFLFSLTWDSMGTNILKGYSSNNFRLICGKLYRNKRPMGLEALLENQLGHLPKFQKFHNVAIKVAHILHFYLRARNWAYFHSMNSSFRDTGRFSKLTYLGM